MGNRSFHSLSALCEDKKDLVAKIHDIATVLNRHVINSFDIGVSHGVMGFILFWTYYYRWTPQEEIDQKTQLLLANHYKYLKQSVVPFQITNLRIPGNALTAYERDLVEVGWAYEILSSLNVVDAECIHEIMEPCDRILFRKMIDITMSPTLEHISDAIIVGSYCLYKKERLPKEFLRRFVLELHSQTQKNNFQYYLHKIAPKDLTGLILLLDKIFSIHPDILYTKETQFIIYKKWTESNESYSINMSTHPNQDIWRLYAMLYDEIYKKNAMDILAQNKDIIYKHILENVDVELGMEGGLMCWGQQLLRIYEQTQDQDYNILSKICCQKFIKKSASCGSLLYGTPMLPSISQNIYHVNACFKNGISGIGLAFLAQLSDAPTLWDEFFNLS